MAKSTTTGTTKEKGNRPIHEIRLGRIKAAVWENETENGTRHNVKVVRLYKDGGNWKDSDSFGRDDLLVVAKVLDLMHTWIFQHAAEAAGNHEHDSDVPY